ncbi:MAG: hypothetical protein HRT47_12325 [Candidatus Caenarcaniphilales bacterium]|nr:hypothetical protein [Candidatus Caenarcaniphilales bacterium]
MHYPVPISLNRFIPNTQARFGYQYGGAYTYPRTRPVSFGRPIIDSFAGFGHTRPGFYNSQVDPWANFASFDVPDGRDSLVDLIDPLDLVNTPEMSSQAFSKFVEHEMREEGTNVFSIGEMHDESVDPWLFASGALTSRNLGKEPVIALEMANSLKNREYIDSFMKDPSISARDLLAAITSDRSFYRDNPNIEGLLELSRMYQIPVELVDANESEISRIEERFAVGDYNLSRDRVIADNVKKIANNDSTVFLLTGLQHASLVSEDREPDRQEKSVLINPKYKTADILDRDPDINVTSIALLSQDPYELTREDVYRLANNDPEYAENSEDLGLYHGDFHYVFRSSSAFA